MLIALCVRVRGKSLKSSHMEPKYKGREAELEDNCARLKRWQQNAKHEAQSKLPVKCLDCLYLVLVQE